MEKNMKTILPIFLCAAIISIAAWPSEAQDWRGRARVTGIVTAPDGSPIQGCEVKLVHQRYSGGPDPVETDEGGRWMVSGLRGGAWLIDFTHPNYQARGISYGVSEAGRNRPIEITLEPLEQIVGALTEGASAELLSAEGLFEEGNYDEALEAFKALTEESPETLAYCVRVAECLFELDRLDEAATEIEAVLQAEPENAAAMTVAGNIAYNLGKYEEAERYYTRLTELVPSDGGVWANLGMISTDLQKYDQAQTAYEKAIEISPEFYDLYVQLAAIQMIANEYNRAIETLELLKTRAPADHPVFSNWGVDDLITMCQAELEKQN